MSLFLIAWRSFQQRLFASLLTTVSLALGVALTVLVLALYGLMIDSFRPSVGCNLIVGAKGSPLQLTLNSIYYLSKPVQNVPYDYYLEFFSEAERRAQVENYGGKLREPNRAGIFSQYMADGVVIPLALGDYFGQFRVVGTTPDMFEKLRWGPDVDRKYAFREGRNFEANSAEHGVFEAVVGWRVSEEMNVRVGDTLFPAHGDPEGKGHKDGFTIVGVLAPTGTPNDRAAFVNLEGFFLMEGHAKPLEKVESSAAEVLEVTTPKSSPALRIDQREVTAILLRPLEPMFAVPMQNIINEGLQAQAAAPVGEITALMSSIVGPINLVLRVITILTCIVAAVGILVSIYNSMQDRRRDIAVMRALGARQSTVMQVILYESALIAMIGGLGGWILAHLTIGLCSGIIEDYTGIHVGFFSFTSSELMIVPIVLGLAIFAGALPAYMAYRTDVGKHLQG